MKLWMFIKKNIKYVFLFIFFFCCLQFFFVSFSTDQIYNYGFSYALSRGEIPYKDFNMIIPPVGPLVYLIPFFLGHSLIIFNLFQSLLLCLLFYFLFKLYDNKAYLFLIILVITLPIPFTTNLFQGYNFLILLEVVIILYLEKLKSNDYLIGIILGLTVFTKQTVGIAICFVSFYYLFKDYKKVLRRICGFLIPCLVFLIYFIASGTLYEFFDMCLFGMFDFTSENSGMFKILSDFYFYVFVLEIFVLFLFIIKDRKNILYYYVLAYSLMAVPLFDYNHVAYFSFMFMFIFVEKLYLRNSRGLAFNICLFSSVFSVVWFLFINGFDGLYLVNYNNLELFTTNERSHKEVIEISKFMEKNENSILLSENSYVVKINLDLDINYYDLLNNGNHGYNGTDKLIKMIKNEKDKYFIVNMKAYEKDDLRQQINKEVMKYVIDNYKKVGEFNNYEVYYKE